MRAEEGRRCPSRSLSKPGPRRLAPGFADLQVFAAAGPTLDDGGAGMTGSLIIMEFEDGAAAEAFSRDDPYARAGLFESVVVRPWRRVLPVPRGDGR